MCIAVNNAIAILRMYGGVLFWLWRSYFVLFPWWNQICISVLGQNSSLLGSKDSAILNSVLDIAGHGHRWVLRRLPGVGVIMIGSFGDWQIYLWACVGDLRSGAGFGGQGGIGILISTFVCFLAAVVWLVCGGGDWALGYVSTQIWDFSNISLFSKILSLKWFGNPRENSYQVCYSRYHVSFYLWLIGSLLKHCKVPKYYNQDCSLMFSEHHRLCSQISESLNFRINEILGI